MSAAGAAHTLLLVAAFWTAAGLYRGARPLAFVAALAAGAGFTHLGWALLHGRAVAGAPEALLAVGTGYCVLFFPLGPLLLAHEPASWRALPLALAVARAGCLLTGCCGGVSTPWGEAPTALGEIAGLLLLHRLLRSAPDGRVAGVFWLGFGLVRLLVEPWRAAPPLGEPAVPAALLALGWTLCGALRALPRPGVALACLALAAPAWWGLRAETRHGAALPARPTLASTRRETDGKPAPLRQPRRVHARREPAPGARRLASPDPRLRAAALEANAARWDADALPLLIPLESDPELGEQARRLVRRYLIWGPVRPTWEERREANRPGFEPWDRAGLRAWRARGG